MRLKFPYNDGSKDVVEVECEIVKQLANTMQVGWSDVKRKRLQGACSGDLGLGFSGLPRRARQAKSFCRSLLTFRVNGS